MTQESITLLLDRVHNGEKNLLNEIYSRLYGDIKHIAKFQINKINIGETITPTVLAHDCYLKLLQQNQINIKDSQHFLNCLSISMRQLLVDVYRSKLSFKNQHKKVVGNFSQIIGEQDVDFKIIELDQLLQKIKKIDRQYEELLNYKLILAMTFTEIAGVLQLSERQVIRIWNQAKALLMALANKP